MLSKVHIGAAVAGALPPPQCGILARHHLRILPRFVTTPAEGARARGAAAGHPTQVFSGCGRAPWFRVSDAAPGVEAGAHGHSLPGCVQGGGSCGRSGFLKGSGQRKRQGRSPCPTTSYWAWGRSPVVATQGINGFSLPACVRSLPACVQGRGSGSRSGFPEGSGQRKRQGRSPCPTTSYWAWGRRSGCCHARN